jgi:outer membrane biogenesis lipoprotein LolB
LRDRLNEEAMSNIALAALALMVVVGFAGCAATTQVREAAAQQQEQQQEQQLRAQAR